MLFRIIILTTIPLLYAYRLEEGKQYDAAQYANKGEKGESGYIGYHENEQGARGHHDKENHRKQYAEKDGHRRGYHHNDGYYADQNQAHKGSNGYHYADHGRYAKGHSTKGRHNIHKLNEYKKNTDFFDEDNDEAFQEKHGGYETSKAVVEGQSNKGGYHKKGFDESRYGLGGFVDKGSRFYQDQGHKNAQGQDEHYGNHAEFGQKGGQESFKKFGFSNQKVF